MSESCSVEMCKSSSRTQCHCCKKNFCRNHFIEHDNLPNLQLNSLVNEINSLNDRLAAFNVEKLTGSSRQKLEQWRTNYHRIIDDIFEAKCEEIDQRANEKIEQQRDEIRQMQSKVAELVRKQETTMNDIDLLKTTIGQVEEEMNRIPQTSFEVVVRPLVIDYSVLHIHELYLPRLDLLPLSPPYKTGALLDSDCPSLASSDQFFLVYDESNLCLMDRELTVVKKSQWEHNKDIFDMCWSSALSRFFIITETDAFIVDENTVTIELIEVGKNRTWYSCTCSDTRLYLSTCVYGSSILQYHLFPSIQLEKEWKSPKTCTPDQLITKVAYNNDTLALTLFDCVKEEKLIELRSSATLERLWLLKLDIAYGNLVYYCCPLNHADWLVWNYDTMNLLHITKDGKLHATCEYNEPPFYITQFNRNQLAVLTKDKINLHTTGS